MSDEKLDPRSLTSEERAIVDKIAFNYADAHYTGDWACYYGAAVALAKPCILARRAMFGQPASNPAKVECPWCGGMVNRYREHIGFDDASSCWKFLCCKPAPPEPVTHEDAEFLRVGAMSMARIIERDEQPEHSIPGWMKVSCLGDVDAGKEDLLCPPPANPECRVCRQHEEHDCPQPEPVAAEMPLCVRRAVSILRVRSLIEMPDTYKSELIEVAAALESFWRTQATLPAKVRMTEVRMPKVPVNDIWRVLRISTIDQHTRERVENWLAELDAAEGRK